MRALRSKISGIIFSDAGFTLLEVAFAGAIMVIVGLAYLGTISQSISIAQLYTDQNQANILIEREIEVLRNTNFDTIPFKQTSEADKLEEVPDYFENIAIANLDPLEPGFVGSSGDQLDCDDFNAFDGVRASDENIKRWVATENGPLVTAGSFVPRTDEPIIIDNPDDPTDPIIINPHDYEFPMEINSESQYVYVAFQKLQKFHRIVYDNRFNVRGDDSLPDTDLDYRCQRNSIWQRDYQIFISADREITPGLPFRPEYNSTEVIREETDLGFGSTGLIEVFNNFEEPLEATVLGVANISVETDSDPTYHYPYATELEAYGYKLATSYEERYVFENGDAHIGNYIMFMPKYLDSGFDLFRRVYLIEGETDFPPTLQKQPLYRIQMKIYMHDDSRNTDRFVKEFWWQEDDKEIMEFTMTLARKVTPVLDNLPGLQDLPRHTYYYNDEDAEFFYTIPGANRIRAHFITFELQNYPDTDYMEFYDKAGNQYGNQYFGNMISSFSIGPYSPWIDGDTIKIQFKSDDYASSIPNANLDGFEVDFVEID